MPELHHNRRTLKCGREKIGERIGKIPVISDQ